MRQVVDVDEQHGGARPVRGPRRQLAAQQLADHEAVGEPRERVDERGAVLALLVAQALVEARDDVGHGDQEVDVVVRDRARLQEVHAEPAEHALAGLDRHRHRGAHAVGDAAGDVVARLALPCPR